MPPGKKSANSIGIVRVAQLCIWGHYGDEGGGISAPAVFGQYIKLHTLLTGYAQARRLNSAGLFARKLSDNFVYSVATD